MEKVNRICFDGFAVAFFLMLTALWLKGLVMIELSVNVILDVYTLQDGYTLQGLIMILFWDDVSELIFCLFISLFCKSFSRVLEHEY